MNLISEHRSVTRSSLVCKATCCGSQSRAPFRRPGSWSQCMRKNVVRYGNPQLKTFIAELASAVCEQWTIFASPHPDRTLQAPATRG